MSVTVSNSPIQDFVHLDDHTQPTDEMTLGFKPFTVLMKVLWNYCKYKCPALQIPWDCHTYNSRHKVLASSVLCLARLHWNDRTGHTVSLEWISFQTLCNKAIISNYNCSFLFLLYLANWTACANQPNPTADSRTGSCSSVWYIYFTSLICFREFLTPESS